MDKLDRLISVIVYADIVGYSSMMQEDESMTLSKLRHFEEVLKIESGRHGGEIVKAYGDGCLMLFSSATNAIKCAISIQKNLREEPQVPLRIGIHVGEIVRKGHDIFGDGINITSRIESMGVANSVLISSDIYFQVKNRPEFRTVKIGDFSFKNIEREITLYAVANDDLTIPMLMEMKGKGQITRSPSVSSSKKLRLLWIPVIFILIMGLTYWSYQQNSVDSTSAKNPPLGGLIFASKIEANGQAIDANTTFSQNVTDLYAVFRANMVPPGMKINVKNPLEDTYYAYLKVIDNTSISNFGWRWYHEGEVVNEHQMDVESGEGVWLQRWDYSGNGVFGGDLGPGTYTIVILIDGNPAMSAELNIRPESEEMLYPESEHILLDE